MPIGIVHLGIGAFHRAHQAVYTDDVLAGDRGAWGICGVQPAQPGRSRPADAAGRPLHGRRKERATACAARVIGSVREVLFLGDERAAIDARLADPRDRGSSR